MLEVTIPPIELYDEIRSEFVHVSDRTLTLRLEHSLLSVHKWEAKWHRPFLKRDHKTDEEMLDYIRCMTLTSGVPSEVYRYFPHAEIKRVNDYINDPMSGTTFRESPGGKPPRREVISAEVIYYQMFTLGIPKECEKWHLNQLLTLIRVFNEKNGPKKKRGKRDILAENARLNAARRAKHNTRG